MQTGDDRSILISTMPATSRDRTAALAVVAVSSVLFACAVPFATVPLAADAGVRCKLPIRAGDQRSHHRRSCCFRSSPSCGRGPCCCWRADICSPRPPRSFTPSPFPVCSRRPDCSAPVSQTTVWLYMIWHGGFPLLALGYALLRDADGGVKIRTSTGRAILGSIIAVGVAISALTWVVTARHDILPTLLSGGHYTPTMIGVVSAVWSLSLAALLALWFRRPHSVIDVWLMVVLCAWLFDIALSAILNEARFDLGFYAGRIYGLCAASFVLAVLLIDNVGLQAQMARLLGTLRREAASEQGSSHRARAAVQRGGGILQRRHHHQDARRHHHRLEPGRGTPVRVYRGRSHRQSHRYHRSAGPARRDARNPRSQSRQVKRSSITKPCGCTRTAARCTLR